LIVAFLVQHGQGFVDLLLVRKLLGGRSNSSHRTIFTWSQEIV
jgi:hypothetical protein